MCNKQKDILDKSIRIYKSGLRQIILLIILLLLAVCSGSFYIGVCYTKENFISEVSVELNQLLANNFSYTCYAGQPQFYVPLNISFLNITGA